MPVRTDINTDVALESTAELAGVLSLVVSSIPKDELEKNEKAMFINDRFIETNSETTLDDHTIYTVKDYTGSAVAYGTSGVLDDDDAVKAVTGANERVDLNPFQAHFVIDRRNIGLLNRIIRHARLNGPQMGAEMFIELLGAEFYAQTYLTQWNKRVDTLEAFLNALYPDVAADNYAVGIDGERIIKRDAGDMGTTPRYGFINCINDGFNELSYQTALDAFRRQFDSNGVEYTQSKMMYLFASEKETEKKQIIMPELYVDKNSGNLREGSNTKIIPFTAIAGNAGDSIAFSDVNSVICQDRRKDMEWSIIKGSNGELRVVCDQAMVIKAMNGLGAFYFRKAAV